MTQKIRKYLCSCIEKHSYYPFYIYKVFVILNSYCSLVGNVFNAEDAWMLKNRNRHADVISLFAFKIYACPPPNSIFVSLRAPSELYI